MKKFVVPVLVRLATGYVVLAAGLWLIPGEPNVAWLYVGVGISTACEVVGIWSPWPKRAAA